MAIITGISRRHFKGRLLLGLIYLLLSAGAVTMVYPFLLMIAGSTKSDADRKELSVVPGYLVSDTLLYRKHIESLFNESLETMRIAYDTDVSSFDSPDLLPPTGQEKLVEQWRRFLAETDVPVYSYALGALRAHVSRGVQPLMLRRFIREIRDEARGDLAQANKLLGSEFPNWHGVYLIPDQYLLRREVMLDEPLPRRVRHFKARQPTQWRYYFSVEGFYKEVFLKTQYTRDIDIYNDEHGTKYGSYDEVTLPRTYPADASEAVRDSWERFVRETLNLLWLRARPEAATPYRDFLKAKYLTIDALNRVYGSNFRGFDDIPLVGEALEQGIVTSDWDSFVQGWRDPDTGVMHLLPVELIEIHSLEFMFRDYLRKQYGSLDALNTALATNFRDFDYIRMPQQQAHYEDFRAMTGSLRWEFTQRNHITVMSYMTYNARALVNTVIYCALAILCALIFNPMAAYALSRFRLPSTYKILLFLMLTMAFPPMVTQIPVFLTLRNLHLLNTFWALILPGLANGYMIFILKGFFDSQPREIYESAALDGAGEWTIFWQITMNLSKPVLAYIGLAAFTHAYSNFLFALLICQDQNMWTLMPTLFQLQQRSGPGVVFASLIIAALPTFAVFVFAQNIIMRGIVVPVEK